MISQSLFFFLPPVDDSVSWFMETRCPRRRWAERTPGVAVTLRLATSDATTAGGKCPT